MPTNIIVVAPFYYPASTPLAVGASVTLPDDLADQMVSAGKARYAATRTTGPTDLTAEQIAATQALVSGAWNAASSGTWRPAALGALPRFSVSGGASGGTWALSYRNAAGAVTTDPAETVAAGVTDVSPVFLDDATEIAVAITGTVTVEVK